MTAAAQLRLVPDSERTWSQGAKANDHGVSLALQENTSRVSPFQVELLQAVLPWASERYGWPWGSIEDWFSTHSRAGRYGGRAKPSAPGPTGSGGGWTTSIAPCENSRAWREAGISRVSTARC